MDELVECPACWGLRSAAWGMFSEHRDFASHAVDVALYKQHQKIVPVPWNECRRDREHVEWGGKQTPHGWGSFLCPICNARGTLSAADAAEYTLRRAVLGGGS